MANGCSLLRTVRSCSRFSAYQKNWTELPMCIGLYCRSSSSSLLACNSYDCLAPYVDIILHRGGFWAKFAASGSVRWCCFRSCWTVLSHVMRGRPSCLLQYTRGVANRWRLETLWMAELQFELQFIVTWHLSNTYALSTLLQDIFVLPSSEWVYNAVILPYLFCLVYNCARNGTVWCIGLSCLCTDARGAAQRVGRRNPCI